MIKFLLSLVRAFSPLWIRMGVNPAQLDAILFVKLTMDDRRAGAFNRARQKQKKAISNSTWITIVMSALMGLIFLFVFFIGGDYVTGLTIYFLMFMVMLSMTLIADFSNVLIDVKDNYIILPKPVNAQTVLMARLLHIMIHLAKIVVPMTLPGIIYLMLRTGFAGGLLFIADAVMATLICVFLINALYLVILKLTSAERFKDIIGGVQIVFSIALFSVYYIAPRLLGSVNLSKASLLGRPYLYPLPPLWLASFWEVLRYPSGQPALLWELGMAAFLLSPLSIWAVVRFLAPSFDRKLSGLGSGTSVAGRGPAAKAEAGKKPVYLRISKGISRGNAEATGFEIAWLLSGRNRDFKLKVYPSFAYVIVYFVYFGLIGKQGSHESILQRWNDLPSTRLYILLIYSSSLAMISAITNMAYSEKYKAAWVYYVSPAPVPGQILTGAIKAMLVKYFVPFYAAISVLAIYVWGMGVLPDLLLGMANVVLFGVFMGLGYLKKMPFSQEINTGAGSGRFMKGLFILAAPGIVGTGHYLIRRLLPGSQALIWVALLLSLVLIWVVYGKYRELSWKELDWS